MEPPSRCVWMPFGFAMRHELGSKGRLSPADISCYSRQVIEICSVILYFNKFLNIIILTITVKRSDGKICVSNRTMDRISRYRSAAGTHGPHAICRWNEFRIIGHRRSRGVAGVAEIPCHRMTAGRVRSMQKRRRATRHRQHVPSCCTCAPAMLAKPRF
jgi:hypothetical protein